MAELFGTGHKIHSWRRNHPQTRHEAMLYICCVVLGLLQGLKCVSKPTFATSQFHPLAAILQLVLKHGNDQPFAPLRGHQIPKKCKLSEKLGCQFSILRCHPGLPNASGTCVPCCFLSPPTWKVRPTAQGVVLKIYGICHSSTCLMPDLSPSRYSRPS